MKLVKIAIFGTAICAVLLLAGCATNKSNFTPTKQRVVVADVPSSFYNCPVIENLPNPATLTNRQAAALLLQLDKNNWTCKGNMDKIKTYIKQLEVIAPK